MKHEQFKLLTPVSFGHILTSLMPWSHAADFPVKKGNSRNGIQDLTRRHTETRRSPEVEGVQAPGYLTVKEITEWIVQSELGCYLSGLERRRFHNRFIAWHITLEWGSSHILSTWFWKRLSFGMLESLFHRSKLKQLDMIMIGR